MLDKEYAQPERDPRDTNRGYLVRCSLSRIVQECQAAWIDPITGEYGDWQKKPPGVPEATLVDMQTANLILQVIDQLSDTNRERYLTAPVDQMGQIAWRLAA